METRQQLPGGQLCLRDPPDAQRLRPIRRPWPVDLGDQPPTRRHRVSGKVRGASMTAVPRQARAAGHHDAFVDPVELLRTLGRLLALDPHVARRLVLRPGADLRKSERHIGVGPHALVRELRQHRHGTAHLAERVARRAGQVHRVGRGGGEQAAGEHAAQQRAPSEHFPQVGRQRETQRDGEQAQVAEDVGHQDDPAPVLPVRRRRHQQHEQDQEVCRPPPDPMRPRDTRHGQHDERVRVPVGEPAAVLVRPPQHRRIVDHVVPQMRLEDGDMTGRGGCRRSGRRSAAIASRSRRRPASGTFPRTERTVATCRGGRAGLPARRAPPPGPPTAWSSTPRRARARPRRPAPRAIARPRGAEGGAIQPERAEAVRRERDVDDEERRRQDVEREHAEQRHGEQPRARSHSCRARP